MSESRRAEDLAAAWWQELSFERSGGRLRRAGGSKRAALAVPEAIDLYIRLRGADPNVAANRVAAVAVALANLRPEPENLRPDRRVPAVFARRSFDDPDSAGLSEARFRRLLQAEGVELLDAFRRLVRLLDGRADPRSLADAILHWGDRMRQRWIFEYYGVAIATPHPDAASVAATAP